MEIRSENAVLVLIEADPNRAGCRLRWWNVKRLAEQQGTAVRQLTLPSEKRLSKHDLPRCCRRLPKGLRLWLRDLAPTLRRGKFLLALASARVVITGKPNDPRLIDGMRVARWFGTRLIVDACDIKPSYVHIQEAFELASSITIPTEALMAAVPERQRQKIKVIPDSLDTACLPTSSERLPGPPPTLNILWFGVIEASGPAQRPSFALFCDLIATSIEWLKQHQASITLVCSRSDEALRHLERRLSPNTLPCEAMDWTIDNMRQALARPGLALIPYPTPVDRCRKSANRMELALYSGKTVLVNGRLPSLDEALREHVIEVGKGINEAFVHTSQEDASAARHYLNRKQELIDQQWCELIR